jgi:hypothetical protein
MSTPEEFISDYEDKIINGLELIESLCRYDSWLVEIEKLETGGFVPRIFEDEEKKIFLNLFSKLEYMELYHNLFNEKIETLNYIQVKGNWIFQNLPSEVEYLNIDPEAEHGIVYKKEQFTLLEEMGKLVEFDIPLQKWIYKSSHSKEQDVKEILLARDYFLVQSKSEIPLAPDSQARKLFPIFITYYAAERFVIFLKNQNKGEYVIKKIPARELFPSLKNMNLEGIVFNCLGPVTPRAFQIQILDLILENV